MSSPLVSVVMPVRNRATLVGSAASSILEQTLTDLELVIVDDGSTDATASVLAGLQANDRRVVLVEQPESGGIVSALNAACAAARGRYLARMDADDISLPQRLEQQVSLLETEPDVGLVGGQMICTSLSGASSWPATYPTDDAGIRRMLGSTNPFGGSAVTMRRETFEECGGHRACLEYAEDYELWGRMLDRCHGANLAEPVLLYRVHPDQSAFRNWRQHCISTLAVEAAMRARTADGRDPLDTTAVVTEEVVRQLGVSDEELRTRFVRSLLSLAALAVRAGYPSERCRLLAEAATEAVRGPIAPKIKAQLSLTQALAAFDEGAWIRGLASLARSIGADSSAATDLASNWAWNHHRWIFRGLERLQLALGAGSRSA